MCQQPAYFCSYSKVPWCKWFGHWYGVANKTDHNAARCSYDCCFPNCPVQKFEHKILGWCKGQRRKTLHLHKWLPFGPCVFFHLPFFFFFLNFCSYIYDEVQIAAFNMICTKHFPCRRSAQRGLFVLYGNRGIRRCATELLQTKASLQQNSGWTSMWETGSKVGFLFLLIHPVLC